jgi:hypothetical protein
VSIDTSRPLSPSEAVDLYESLDRERRAAVMAAVSLELTVAFRGIHHDLSQSPESETAGRLQRRLAGINEIQHQIADRLLIYLEKRDGGQSDRDFLTTLFRMARGHDVRISVENALLTAVNRYRAFDASPKRD